MANQQPRVVRDIMTQRVLCLLEEENLEHLAKGMARFAFRHLPVIDDGKLVGIVSQRDYLEASVSSLDPEYALKDANLKHNIFVAEIMRNPVVSVRPETPLLDAAKLLREHKFGCLPVTEDDGTLVGIVTEYDFTKLAERFLGEEAVTTGTEALAVSADAAPISAPRVSSQRFGL
jgi:CBS domain-containing protein